MVRKKSVVTLKKDEHGTDYKTKKHLYKPEFCGMLIEHRAGGLSFTSFAGLLKVAPATLYLWEENFPEFKEAKEIAYGVGLLDHEIILRKGTLGEIKGFNVTAHIWNGKNLFPEAYKEQSTVVHKNAIDESMTPDQAAAAYDKVNQK